MPRPIPHVVGEINAVERMCRRLDKQELDKQEILRYISESREEKDKKIFLSKIERVTQGPSIELDSSYVLEKLGGIPYEKMASEHFFNKVLPSDQHGFLTFTNNCVLRKGSMFGEQALIFKKRRAAHCIVVSEKCDICVMNGKDFKRIFGPLQRREEEKKKHFFEKEIISDPDMRSLARLIGVNFTKRHYYKSKVLFSKGDRPDKLYLIFQGQILIWDDELEAGEKNSAHRLLLPLDSLRREQKPLFKTRAADPQNKKRFDLMISGPGKMIGEEELFTGKRRRYHALVESESIIYEVEYERMLNVCNENHFVRNVLKQKIADKEVIVNSIVAQKRRVEGVRDAFDKKVKIDIETKRCTAEDLKTFAFLADAQTDAPQCSPCPQDTSSRLRTDASALLPPATAVREALRDSSSQLLKHSLVRPKPSQSRTDIKSLITRTKVSLSVLHPHFAQRKLATQSFEHRDDSLKLSPFTVSPSKPGARSLSPAREAASQSETVVSKREIDSSVERDKRDMNQSIHQALHSDRSMILKSIMNTADAQLRWDSSVSKAFKRKHDVLLRSRKQLHKQSLPLQSPAFENQPLSGSLSASNQHSRVRSLTDLRLQPLAHQSSRLLFDGPPTSGNTPLKSHHFSLSKKSTAVSPIKIFGPHQSMELSKAELSTPVRAPPMSFLLTHVGDASMENLFVCPSQV